MTGRLIPAGDPSALADAIGEMVSDPVGAAEMGRRGRERAVELYDLRRTTRAIEEVYEKVLAGR